MMHGQRNVKLDSSCRSVYPSACPAVRPSVWKISAPTKRTFLKFDVWRFFENLSRKSKH